MTPRALVRRRNASICAPPARWLRPALSVLVLIVATLGFEWPAQAYPFMIRHGYAGCSTCHSDPSGGNLLVPYGRAQSELLLSTRWRKAKEGEPSRFSEQLFGIVPLPQTVQVGADLRNAYIWTLMRDQLVDHRYLQMRADLMANVHLKRFRAYASLGYARAKSRSQSERAWITRESSNGNLVGREYWVGYDLSPHLMVRGGRLDLPFGLRVAEHTEWVRAATVTDIDQDQQHGASILYDGNRFRGELMAILGNYQISPDRYRERGYSAYLDVYLMKRWSAGISSRVTGAATSLEARTRMTTEAHGAFTRVMIVKPLVLMGELDGLIQKPGNRHVEVGHASLLQLDWEAVSGLHAMATGESLNRGDGAGGMLGGWLSLWWFFLPHFDARADFVIRTLPHGPLGSLAPPATHTILLQLHAYL